MDSCRKLYDKRHKRTQLSLQFANLFKTYVGGGENEVYGLATLAGFDRFTPNITHEVLMRENVITKYGSVPLDCSERSKSNNNSNNNNSSIYCHLDVTNLKWNDLQLTTSDSGDDDDQSTLLQNIQSVSPEQRWLTRLSIAMNKLNIDGMRDEDIEFPAVYISQFIQLFERAVMKIDDNEDFFFLIYNTMKKMNILLRLMVKKMDYVMNFTDKLKFQQLTRKVFDVWNGMIQNHTQLFTRLELIAVHEFREDFGCEKSETLKAIYELFYSMNTPVRWAVPSKKFNGTRFACEFLFKVYELTLGSIIFSNLKLIALAQDDNKLLLFKTLLNAFRNECEQMSVLHKSCPSKTAVHIVSKKVVEYIFSLNTDFGALVTGLFKRYNCTSQEWEQMNLDPCFILYTQVPEELESAFSLELGNDALVAQKFSAFIYSREEQLADSLQAMSDLTMIVSKANHVQSVVNKYKKGKVIPDDQEQQAVEDEEMSRPSLLESRKRSREYGSEESISKRQRTI